MKIHDLLNIESSYINMGARQYDPAIGRFPSPDPLLEAFPGQSPYNYAFNSPMLWSDPSGLAPEKEQKRDEVQVRLYADDLDGYDVMTQMWEYLEYRMAEQKQERLQTMLGFNKMSDLWAECMSRSYGGGSSGNRTGEGQGEGDGGTAENGQGGATESGNGNKGGKTSSQPANYKKNGLKIPYKRDQKIFLDLIGSKYKGSVSFDPKGFVNFSLSNNEIQSIFQNCKDFHSKKSLISDVLFLALNDVKTYTIIGISHTQKRFLYYDDWSDPNYFSFKIYNNWFRDNFDFYSMSHGIFLASCSDYSLAKSFGLDISRVHFSGGMDNIIYYNLDWGNPTTTISHEIRCHAIDHLLGHPWWHSANNTKTND